jgi:hypothetical protein
MRQAVACPALYSQGKETTDRKSWAAVILRRSCLHYLICHKYQHKCNSSNNSGLRTSVKRIATPDQVQEGWNSQNTNHSQILPSRTSTIRLQATCHTHRKACRHILPWGWRTSGHAPTLRCPRVTCSALPQRRTMTLCNTPPAATMLLPGPYMQQTGASGRRGQVWGPRVR